MEKELNITAIPNADGEIIIRHGEAPKVYDPVKLKLSGTIQAPGDFVGHREKLDAQECNVVADYTKRSITLTVGEDSVFATTVIGALDLHPDLKAFSINEAKQYTHQQLLNLIKFKGAWFKNKEQHISFIQKLQDFQGTVDQAFANANDFKGSQAFKRVNEIKTNLDLEFVLSMPIFTGFSPQEFTVDICVDLKDGAVIFWLESVGLHETIIADTEAIFEEQLARLSDYLIIKQW